jgi:protein-tyrosine-phosphatase
MAETFLRRLLPELEVASAGTMVPPDNEGKKVAEVSPSTIDVMKAYGFDMGTATINQLTPEMVHSADKIVLVGPTPGGPLPPYLSSSTKLETWDVPDPGYGHVTKEEARDMILTRINDILEVALGIKR